MIENWLMSAERIAHLAAVSGANTIGVISIDGDAGVSTLSRLICRVLSGGKSKALLVNLASPVLDAAAGNGESADRPSIWQRLEAGEEDCSEMAARPTAATRFLFNDVSSLQQTWRDELRSHARLVVDLPPVLHDRDDLLSPLAAAASCDAVFLVCLQGRTAGWRLAEAVALLRAAHVNLAGVIVNGRDYSCEEFSTDRAPISALRDLPEDSVARTLVQAAWRRRYLLLVPILVMLPLSVVAAKLLPVPYVAKALLLLQEPGVEGPVSTSFAVSERIEERVPGLESLLKSHRVLAPALADLQKAGLAPAEPEGAVEDFGERLSLKLVGLDILEIDLKGNQQQGLGRQLEEVVTRFLAALTTDQGAMTAGQLLVQDSLSAWRGAEQAYAATLARLSEIYPKGPERALAQLGSLDGQIKGKRAELAAADAELKRQGPSPSADAIAKKDRLLEDIAQLEAESRKLRDLAAEYRRLEEQRPRLEAEVASAQQAYTALSEQYERGAVDYPQRLLDAPERIRIIDPPGDPETAETSRLLYVVFGVAASILLGVGLAWGAEQTDPSLRERHEFASVSGLPVVAHLPRFAGPDNGGSNERRSHGPRGWAPAAAIVLIVLATLLGLQLLPAETTTAVTQPLWEFAAKVRSWIGGARTPQSALLESFLSGLPR